MHITKFICGMSVAVFAVAATSWSMGWSTGAIIAISVATLVTAQVFYFAVIAATAWFRGKKTADTLRPAEHNHKLN